MSDENDAQEAPQEGAARYRGAPPSTPRSSPNGRAAPDCLDRQPTPQAKEGVTRGAT